MRRQRQRIPHQPILELGDQVRLPPQTLHLPCAQREGRDGDDGQEDEARAVLALAAPDDARGLVGDGDEVRVVGGLFAGVVAWAGVGEGPSGRAGYGEVSRGTFGEDGWYAHAAQ